MKLAGDHVYGKSEVGKGAIFQKHVACSDVTFNAMINPVVYEGGIPVFIDTEYDTWNMDPVALKNRWRFIRISEYLWWPICMVR